MVHWIHDHATNFRPAPEPTVPACLAEHDIAVLFIADGTNRCTTFAQNTPHFTRRQAQDDKPSFFCEQLAFVTGGTRDLTALSGSHFHIVYQATHGNIGQRHGIAGLVFRPGPAHDRLPGFYDIVRKHIAFFAIGINDQSNPRGTVGIILNSRDFAWNAILVLFKIHNAVLAF
ncbi:MAG: hypothetical protein BWY09_02468 [Candidatus Hydrogenedentes bacterium ADurb.Bin179]|nr:MAG: hypothetical protein BWY09_02468 [Candidatus Hydrogenedentes bacterium ADurb.Bin179]